MHDCPRSEESDSLYSCINTVFLRSLGAFRLRSACHIQFYYPRLLGRWSTAGEVHCWDVSASRIPWRTCILQTGVGCSLNCYGLCKPVCASLLSPARGGVSQERYPAWGCAIKPLLWGDKNGHVFALWSTCCDQSELFTKCLGPVLLPAYTWSISKGAPSAHNVSVWGMYFYGKIH